MQNALIPVFGAFAEGVPPCVRGRILRGDEPDAGDLHAVAVKNRFSDVIARGDGRAKLTEADMFIYSGNGMEAWAEDVAETLPDTVKVVNASERLTNLDGSDPHVWLNIDNARIQMQTICDALIETDPDFADAYARNMRLYSVKLDELKESYENYNLAGITLAVTHGAYGYLCEEFGMTQLALEGVAGDSDPSPAQMAEFVDEVKARNVKCIYYDPIEGGKLAEKAAKEAGVLAEKFYTFEYDEQDRDYVTVMMGNLLGNETICL